MSNLSRNNKANNTSSFTEEVLNSNQKERSQAVQSMFDSIANRYDLGNTVLSFGFHYLWRKVLVGLLPKAENFRVLDICTGTGDLLPLLAKRFSASNPNLVEGIDFSNSMLECSRKKYPEYKVQQADALNLPHDKETFDVASVAFGVRNYANLSEGLKEANRVLKTGGHLLVLEFGQPKFALFNILYSFYSKHLMPIIGGLITGNREAYSYLPETAKAFPCNLEFGKELELAGFEVVKIKPLFLGIAYAYLAKKN